MLLRQPPPPRLSEPFRTISNSKPVDFEKFNFCVGSLRQVTIGDGSLRRYGLCRKATDGYRRLSTRLATATEGLTVGFRKLNREKSERRMAFKRWDRNRR